MEGRIHRIAARGTERTHGGGPVSAGTRLSRLVAAAALLGVASAGGCRADEGLLEARTASCRVAIASGVVVRIVNTLTGEVLADAPALQSGASHLPVGIDDAASRYSVWGATEHREVAERSLVYPGAHRPGAGSAVAVEDGGTGRRTIRWRGLQSGAPAKSAYPDESFSLSVEAGPVEDGLTIVARGEAPGGLAPGVSFAVAGIPDTCRVIVPGLAGVFFHRSNVPALYRTAFESSAWGAQSWDSPLVIVQAEKGGFMLWSEDPRSAPKLLGLEHRDGVFNLVFDASMDEGAPGAEFVSPPWRFSVYRGNWTVPAGLYKAAMAKRLDVRPIAERDPAWFRNVRVVCGGLSRPTVDALSAAFDPASVLIVDQGSQQGCSLPDISLNAQWTADMKYAQGKGFRVMGFSSHRFIAMPRYPRGDLSHYKCPEKRPECVCIRKFGGPEKFYAMWARKPYMYNRYGNKNQPLEEAMSGFIHMGWTPWRTFLLELHKEVYDRYRIDGWYFDTAGNIGFHPYGPVEGMNEVMGERAFFAQLRRLLPGALFMCEAFDENSVGACDLDWNVGRTPVERVHPISGYLYADFFRRWDKNVVDLPGYLAGTEASGALPTVSLSDHPGMELAARYALVHAREGLRRHTPARWEPGVLSYYRDKDGNDVRFLCQDGRQWMVRRKGGAEEVLLGVVSGTDAAALPAGTVVGRWPAYDGTRAIGLLPERSYPFFLRARRPSEKLVTVSRLPAGAAVAEIRQAAAGEESAPGRRYDRDIYTCLEFAPGAGAAGKGAVEYTAAAAPAYLLLSDGRAIVPDGPRGAFETALPGTAVFVWSGKDVLKAARYDLGAVRPVAVHAMGLDGFDRSKEWPNNQIGLAVRKKLGAGPEVGGIAVRPVSSNKEAVLDWLLEVPAERPVLRFRLGYSEGRAGGKPLRYVVRVNGRTVFDENVGDATEWLSREVDLSEWRGRPVLLSLATDSRTGRCGQWAVGMWAGPTVTTKE